MGYGGTNSHGGFDGGASGATPDGAGAPAAAARVHECLRPATALLAGQYNANTPQLAAGVVIVVAVFLFVQRALVRGITAGVGK